MSARPPGLAPVIARIGPASAETKSLPMLPWFPAAFLSSTRGWNLAARAIYRELLDSQWELGSVPSGSATLQKLIGATAAEWKSWPIVEPKFPIGADGRRRNPTLEKHRIKAFALHAQHRRGARTTNTKRWGMQVDRLTDGGGNDAQ
jgi:hypothetical protein